MDGAVAGFTLSYGDYTRFAQLIHRLFGLHFTDRRRPDLERGIRHAFAASTCASLDAYFDLLQDEFRGAVERARLVNALTVSETHFFRDEAQFDALYNRVLPEIIERRRALRTLRIWSAGCASGEEPYSIAMLLRSLLPDIDEWSVTILGTDVNTESLDRARRAVYSEWAFRENRAKEWRTRYFVPEGKSYALIPQVRNMVTFSRLNLVADPYPAYESNTTLMDLVLCRNVTIYLSEEITRQVVNRFYDALIDGGWLVIGHSEHTMGTYRRFQAQTFPGTILYQRTGQPTPWPQEWEWLVGTPTPGALPTPQHLIPQPEKQGASRPSTKKTTTPSTTGPVPVHTGHVRQPVTPSKKSDSSSVADEKKDPLESAATLLEYGHSEQARAQLLQVLAEQPRHAQAATMLGQACANLGAWEEAQHWCRQAIAIDRLARPAYYTLALVLQHQGALDQAVDAMRKVVYLDRNDVLGHFGLADLYRSQGQIAQALKSLDNARRLLNARPGEEMIFNSGGVTVGRLRETIVRQQQQWEAEVSRPKEIERTR